MATFDSIITLAINIESPPVPAAQFGVSMVVDTPGAGFTERIRYYESTDEVTADTDLSTFQSNALKDAFAQTPTPQKLAAGRWDGVETWTAALDAILAADDGWFGFTISSRAKASQLLAAAWAESNLRMYAAQSSDTACHASAYTPSAGGDIMSELKDLSYRLSHVIWHTTDSKALDFAWLATDLAVDPDVETTIWANKTMAGFTPDTALTSTQKSNILSKSGNMYLTLGGQGATGPGTMADGTFIDLILTREWLRARLFEAYATLQLRVSNRGQKVPYTNKGIQQFVDATMEVLDRGIDAGHFRVVAPTDANPDGFPAVIVSDIADVPSADLAARKLRITTKAIAAGAIQEVDNTVYIATAEL